MRIKAEPKGNLGWRKKRDSDILRENAIKYLCDSYHKEVSSHLDVGLEVLSGRAEAGPAIRTVARLLDLDFLPLRWERFDLLIPKERFFEKRVQLFLGLLHDKAFLELADELKGYDLQMCGKMVFPEEVPS